MTSTMMRIVSNLLQQQARNAPLLTSAPQNCQHIAGKSGPRGSVAAQLDDLSRTFVASCLLFDRRMKTNTPADSVVQKDPDEWKSGDEPMTPAQRSYLETLARDVGEEFEEELTKAEASKRIEELRERSPRVTHE
jgi:hypothetical protein